MNYCVCWVVGEWFVCILVLKLCVDLGKLLSCVCDANFPIFITYFDYNELVIFEFVQCHIFFSIRLL